MLASVCNGSSHSSTDCLSVDNHLGLLPPPLDLAVPFIMTFDNIDPRDVLNIVGRLQLKCDGTW
jgi:hypothetical protein